MYCDDHIVIEVVSSHHLSQKGAHSYDWVFFLLLKFVLAHDNFIATPSLQLNLFPAFFFPQSFSNSGRVFLKKLGTQGIFVLKKYT